MSQRKKERWRERTERKERNKRIKKENVERREGKWREMKKKDCFSLRRAPRGKDGN